MVSLTLDSFNSAYLIDELSSFVHNTPMPRRVVIDKRTLNAKENRTMAETFRRLCYSGHIHAPLHALARDELKYLRENNGKVEAATGTKDDIAIAMFHVVELLMNPYRSLFEELGRLQLRPMAQGGIPPMAPAGPFGTNENASGFTASGKMFRDWNSQGTPSPGRSPVRNRADGRPRWGRPGYRG